MSLKNRDNHNRWRNKTVAFRVSPEEDRQIETFVKLSGLTKQDYRQPAVKSQRQHDHDRCGKRNHSDHDYGLPLENQPLRGFDFRKSNQDEPPLRRKHSESVVLG